MEWQIKTRNHSLSVLERVNDLRTLNFMDDMVRIVDAHGDIVFANDRMKRFCGMDPTGMNCLQPDGAPIPRTIAMSTFVTEASVMSEFCMKGHVFSVKSSPIFDEERTVYAAIEVFRDITIQNNITLELFEANGKMTQDIELARSIQTSMLPRLSQFGGIHFASRYIPSNQLSGDMFDLIPLDGTHLALYIADVVGHGVSASILTMFVRQSMRSILSEVGVWEPNAVLQGLRSRFEEIALDDSQYFSLFYALIDTKEGRMRYANAGHNCPPMVVDQDVISYLSCTGQLISNVFDNRPYHVESVALVPGQKILFYTDGVVETVNREGVPYGREGLERLVRSVDHHIPEHLIEDLNVYRWGKQKDDIALLLMETVQEGSNA